MPKAAATSTANHQAAQIAGAVAEGLNRAREAAADNFRLTAEEAARLASALGDARDAQQAAFARAMAEMRNVRDFVGSPERILGSVKTKHGEIAEQLEVALTNARDHMAGRSPTATFEGVGRLAPEDYLKAGVEVQSKFINGTNNALDHVLDHLKKYEVFGRDGSFYDIPRDQHADISRILRGDHVEGLAARTQETIRGKLEEIASLTGRPVTEVVRPAQSSYAEVQQGVIHRTIDGHEQRLTGDNAARTAELDTQRNEQEARQHEATGAAAQAQKPTWQEAGEAAAVGGLVGAGLRATTVLWGKHQEGKTWRTLTAEDWKEVGLESAKGGALGAVSGGAIYLLTNCAGLSAPFAAAVVSSGQAVASLVASYERGEISAAECAAMGQIACAEGAFVACGTVIGQTIIPVPIVGAVVGSTAARIFISTVQENYGHHAAVLAAQLERQFAKDVQRLSEEHRKLLADIEARIEELGDLTAAAFDPRLNARLLLSTSVALAEVYGVEAIKTDEELDRFVLGAEVIRANEAAPTPAQRSA